jgi:uncharacterized protein YndB with AHSA1/START domain
VTGTPERVDRASRIVAAPVERVYAALVDGEAVVRWLPPDGATGAIEAFEPWAGGAFRMTLHFAASGGGKTTSDSDTVDARFVEVAPNERIVQDVDFVSEEPAFAGTMRMTWSVAPRDSGTEITVAAEHVPSGISKEDHAKGLASSLANLAAYVEDRRD